MGGIQRIFSWGCSKSYFACPRLNITLFFLFAFFQEKGFISLYSSKECFKITREKSCQSQKDKREKYTSNSQNMTPSQWIVSLSSKLCQYASLVCLFFKQTALGFYFSLLMYVRVLFPLCVFFLVCFFFLCVFLILKYHSFFPNLMF